MIKLSANIFLFKGTMNDELIDKFLSIRSNIGHDDRINIDEVDQGALGSFNDFFLQHIEPLVLDDYFSIYDLEKGIGYNSSKETVKGLKEYVATKWRNVFMLRYTDDIDPFFDGNTHWDFSGFTAVVGLTSNYEGGVLGFPRQGVECRLEKGDVVVFAGGLTHPHYVTQVTKGIRDVLVAQSWMPIQEDYKPLI
jgi:hypothetical protein